MLLALASCASTPEPAAPPPTVKTTAVRVFGTIERPGSALTPREPGVACTSSAFNDIRETVLWWVDAGTQSLGGGRLGQGHVRATVNTKGPGPGPCSFPFEDTVDMPPEGAVVIHFANLPPMPLNRTDILTGTLQVQTSLSGHLFLQTGY